MTDLTYNVGTVSIENGSTTVTGTDAFWAGVNAQAHDRISIGGASPVDIASITDETTLELLLPWAGETKEDVEYAILQTSPLRFAGGQVAKNTMRLIEELNAEGLYKYVATGAEGPDNLTGNDGQYALQAATGKLWLMEGGVWTFVGVFKGVRPQGAWDDETQYLVSDLVQFAGRIYFAKRDNIGQQPDLNPDDWDLYLAGGDRYDIVIDMPGRPGSGEQVAKWVAPGPVTFAAGLLDSVAEADAAAEAEAEFSIQKNGVAFATMTFAADGAVASFTCDETTEFARGDVLTVHAPDPRDDTLTGVSVTLVGYR